MTEKELRRMSRADLIEIIYEVRRNEEALKKENEQLKKELEDREVKYSRVGSLAELCAGVNNLFEAAQGTANRYVEEILAIRARAEAKEAELQRKLDELSRQGGVYMAQDFTQPAPTPKANQNPKASAPSAAGRRKNGKK